MAGKKEEDFEDDDIQNHESEYEDTPDSEDHDDDSDDERIVSEGEKSEEDEEREKIRERRREQRKHKKEMAKAREQVLRSELAARDQMLEAMQQRLAALEQNGTGNAVAHIDQTLNQLANAYVEARTYLEQGTEKQNGKLVAEATERMQQIRLEAEKLAHRKNAIVNSVRTAQQTPQIDPRLKNYAGEWMRENSWYNPEGKDRETSLVRSIDAGLANEGWNPNTPEYWEELSERIKTALPHRAKSDYTDDNRRTEQRTKTSSPVAGSSRASVNSKSNSGYTLSPERVEAMKEAGVWDDPKKRAAMIEAYKRYDKQNKAA